VKRLWKEQLESLRKKTKLSKSNAPLLLIDIPARELELDISGAKAFIKLLKRAWRGY